MATRSAGRRGEDGRHHFTLFIENGRIVNRAGRALMDGLREIARIHRGTFRLTPNQNLVIADIAPRARPKIAALLEEYGLDDLNRQSALRLNSMACVALPTCGLAMAESERYLPTLVTKIETILANHGLGRGADHDPHDRLSERVRAALCRRNWPHRPRAR